MPDYGDDIQVVPYSELSREAAQVEMRAVKGEHPRADILQASALMRIADALERIADKLHETRPRMGKR